MSQGHVENFVSIKVVLTLFLQYNITCVKNTFFKAEAKGRSSWCFLALLFFLVPFKFPRSTEAQPRGKEPTLLFLVYKWLIILGNTVAGPRK